MAFKKSKLFNTLWEGCNLLRGGMDSSQYKDYILTLLFVKYVSDKAGDPSSLIVVPEGAGFKDMQALHNQAEIGDKINKILAKLAQANQLVGVVDVVDFNDSAKLGSGPEMVGRLTGMVRLFEHPGLDFRNHRAGGSDILGDAYEFLMKKFATESGKSKGQFYTPGEVSLLCSWLVGARTAKQGETIYDPTCGSGSMLLRCYAEARDCAGVALSVYGQEMDVSTYGLSRINMVIHGLADADIRQGNTLADPKFTQPRVGQPTGAANPKLSVKQFNYVVANPPYSAKSWSNGFEAASDLFDRFGMGLPPEKNGDYAFILHILASLLPTGKAAVVLPHGVLFRGNAEGTLRDQLIKKGWLRAIVGLPANLFYGTGIPASILLLDKEAPEKRKGVYMVDASKGYAKDGSKNKLRHRDMRKIIDAFDSGAEIPGFSRMVPWAEIHANEGNLNLPRYIDSSDPEDIQDLGGHLLGGIPQADIDAMADLWAACPTLKAELFKPSRPGYLELAMPKDQLRDAFDANADVKAFKAAMASALGSWRADAAISLRDFAEGSDPRRVIEGLSNEMLAAFENAGLVDKYDAHQKLMDLWDQSMHDDLFAISDGGWLACKDVEQLPPPERKEKGAKAAPVVVAEFNIEIGSGQARRRYQSDMVEPLLVAKRFFSGALAALQLKEAELASAEQAIEEAMEEHGEEDGALADYMEEGKWMEAKPATASAPAKAKGFDRLAKVKDFDAEFGENAPAIQGIVQNSAKVKKLKTQIGQLKDELWSAVLEKIGVLTLEETQQLMIEDKWLDRLASSIEQEAARVMQAKVSRVQELATRYESSVQDIERKRQELANRHEQNMKLLGF